MLSVLPMAPMIRDTIVFEGLPVEVCVAVFVLRLCSESFLAMRLEDIVKFLKKITYDGEDGGLKTARSGRMLTKRSEDVTLEPSRKRVYYRGGG